MQSLLQSTIGLGPDPIHPSNLSGRVALVVGGAMGIGFEVSRALANAGCRVLVSPGAEVEWHACDMGDLAQVREVFTRLVEEGGLDRLDYLVLSAGINANEFGLDRDGIDRHFGVNFLGQFYVVNLLWPVLRKTARAMSGKPRVVFEASEMHRTAPGNVHFASLEEINDESLGPAERYGRTKLAMILFAKYGLAGRVIKDNEDDILAVSVHPGAVNTAMQQQWKDAYPGLTGKLLTWAMLAFGRDVKQGSYSALWALTSDKVQNGWYYKDLDQPGKESSQASDENLGAALWDLSHRIIKEKLGEDALADWKACA
ncbi:hypothetical protein C8A01DRAFT_50498 [Parachaetomium inaequale]|uniref:Short-chain dehydrogenase n=1 Tax=Parachaetomium inaequale TaxID=2588326 RepID=A0AAN6SMJ7_9PEZI|nr:hypothetical protein C8A01DRAFT_50498 [Parachaetomium inaequale]